jgi:hypothetical protein
MTAANDPLARGQWFWRVGRINIGVRRCIDGERWCGPAPRRSSARAIWAAVVVGYTWLMQADEEGTFAAPKFEHALLDPEIKRHRSRVIKLTDRGRWSNSSMSRCYPLCHGDCRLSSRIVG